MQDTKIVSGKVPEPRGSVGPDDGAEVTQLLLALDALEVSETDDPTEEETHRLRRDVVRASVALERRQAAGRQSK